MTASMPPALVPALLLLLLATSAASSSRRPTHQPPPFPAGLAPLHQQHSSGRYAASAVTASAAAAKPFTAHYFQQELDHFTFTPNSSALFSQKYLLNDTFWRQKPTAGVGPLFVYTGNEGDIEWFATNTGFMFDIAPDFGALLVFIEVPCFFTSFAMADILKLTIVIIGDRVLDQIFGRRVDSLEALKKHPKSKGDSVNCTPDTIFAVVLALHRFYGESKPFGNDSYKSADTLGYLTSTQALADFAVLITSLKQNLSAVDAPVVVFGGSYGGMLASWFRLKYPHVAMGALASSAPILQFDDITPWSSFYDAISQDFKSESLNCFSVIKAVWDVLDDRASNDTGLLELSKTFRACKTVRYPYSLPNWLWTAFTYTAMVDYPTPANFMMNLPAYPVKEMCKIIDSFPAGADVVEKAFAAASLYYNYTGDQKCFEVEGGDDPHGLSGWGWQACTEMVMPMTVSNESMFPPSGFSYEEKSEGCLASYGVRPRMNWITTEYGGHKIDKVLKRFGSNIIFSNGMRDPWSRGGVLKNISSSIIALVTEKGAHHLDFRSATKDDPDWVVEQRRQEVEIIHGWIDQYNKDIAQM